MELHLDTLSSGDVTEGLTFALGTKFRLERHDASVEVRVRSWMPFAGFKCGNSRASHLPMNHIWVVIILAHKMYCSTNARHAPVHASEPELNA